MATKTLAALYHRVGSNYESLRYYFARHYFKTVIGHIDGSKFSFHWSIEARNPQQIKIGANCILKKGTILNGRTDKRTYGLELGEGVYIKEYCYLDAYNGFIVMGRNCSLGQYCIVGGHGGVTIGDYVMVGPYSYIIPSNHVFNNLDVPYMLQGNKDESVTIEDNVWIGGGVIVLAGVVIGRNSVIGAGSVVTRDVPRNSIYVSQEPRILRHLHGYRPNKLET